MASTTAEFAGPPKELHRLAKDPDEMVFGDTDSGGDCLDGERIPAVAHHEIDRTHHGTGQWTPSHSVGVQELADVVGVNGLGDVAGPERTRHRDRPGRGARGDDLVIRFGAAVVTVAAVPWKATVFWRRGGATDQPLARRARFWRRDTQVAAGSD